MIRNKGSQAAYQGIVLLDLNPDHDLITRDGFEYQGEAHKAFPK